MRPQVWLQVHHGVAECGGAVTGDASWSGNTGLRRIDVVLRYLTQGRGDVDSAVVARCGMGDTEAGRGQFRLDVPRDGPVTYNGQLMRLRWQVAFTIARTRGFGPRDSGPGIVDLVVVPRGWITRS